MKTYQFFCLALVLVGTVSASAKARIGGADIEELVQICNDDYGQYNRQLGQVRETLVREINAMTNKEYFKLLDEQDPRIVLAISTWPEIIPQDDEFRDDYSYIAGRHQKVLAALNQQNMSSTDRRKLVVALDNAVGARYYEEVEPMKSLIACYAKQASK